MKIQDMFKKVESYNEIAEVLGNKKVYINFVDSVGYNVYTVEKLETYKEAVKHIRNEYVKEVAEALLHLDYEFNKERQIGWIDAFGTAHDVQVSFELCER